MAGTVSFVSTTSRIRNLTVWTVEIDWVGDSSDGTVPATAFPARIMGGAANPIPGGGIGGSYLFEIRTIPGAGTPPTDNYDITLTDSDGIDILGGAGANRSSTTKQRSVPVQSDTQVLNGPVYVDPSSLTFNLANNSVHSATGTVKLRFVSEG